MTKNGKLDSKNACEKESGKMRCAIPYWPTELKAKKPLPIPIVPTTPLSFGTHVWKN